MLALETDGGTARECGSVLSFVAVCPVVSIDLNAGFGCVNLHGAPAIGFCHLGCEAQLALFLLVKHEAMVVAGTVLYLYVVGIDVPAHGFGCAEVKGCAFHEAYFACGDGRFVDRNIIVGVDFANEIVDGRCRVCDSGKAEKTVMCKVHHRFLVCTGEVLNH